MPNFGTHNGIRTRVNSVKGCCPNQLDDASFDFKFTLFVSTVVTLRKMVGVMGFEPTIAGLKVRCLYALKLHTNC